MRKKKNNLMKIRINWSALPPELLDIIANKLKIYIDYVRFRAVCATWRSSVSPKPQHLPTQLPWLLFPFSTNMATECTFLDPATNEFHCLSLTESSGSRCCGSSLGWLVFVEESNPTIRLVNPLTRKVIHLPPVTTIPNVWFSKSMVGKEYLVKFLSDGSRVRYSMKEMRDQFIKKIVLSSSSSSVENDDYIALLIFYDYGYLAFHKKGAKKWSIIKEAGDFLYQDAIFYNGSFYAITTTGSIAICDLSGVSPVVTRVTLSSIPSDRVGYLVNTLGKLLLVTRKIELVDREFDSDHDYEYELVNETVEASLFKYDSSKRYWVKMDTLSDHMLFLGRNSSVCLPAYDFCGSCEKNSIYFSSDKDLAVYGIYDCVLYRVDNDEVEPLPCADSGSQKILHPSIWVTPNPC